MLIHSETIMTDEQKILKNFQGMNAQARAHYLALGDRLAAKFPALPAPFLRLVGNLIK